MASGIITLSSTKSNLEGRIVWESVAGTATENRSSVTAHLQVRRNDGYTTKGTWSGAMRIGDVVKKFSVSSTSVGLTWVTTLEFSNYQAHNADGTGSCFIEAYCNAPSGTSLAGHGVSGNATVTLDRIARYANITSLLVKSRTINSITLSYATDRSASIYCSIDGGATWLNNGDPFKTETTSGDITINFSDKASTTRLAPNATYNFTILARETTSSLDTTKSISATTYDIAKLVSVPDVNIGNKQTITWTNPSGATTSLKLAKTDNTQIANIGTVTGTSKDYTPTASTIYALTPNSNEYTARYIITTTANGQSYTNAKDFKFKVTNSNPTFTTYTYADVNSTTTALTGNNQILVKGYSNNKVTITTANKAVAKNSATMKTYKLVQSSTTGSVEANYSSSASVTLQVNKITSNVMTVSATDSRGNSTSVQKTVSSSNYKEYADVTIKSVTAVRGSNGVGQAVTLSYNGTFWNSSFGSVANAITVTYQYKKTTASSWTTGATTLTPTISGNNYSGSISIQGDLGADGFDVAESYNIKLTVKDKLVTKTYSVTLGAGTPAIAIHKSNVAIGQKYDTSEGSKLQVNGAINIPSSASGGTNGYKIGKKIVVRNNDTATILSAYGGSGVILRPNGDTDNTGQATLGTDGTLTATKFSGPATQVYGTLTNPTSATNYYVPFHSSSSSGNKSLRNNDGIRYRTLEGTESAAGLAILLLGNGVNTGTAGNKYGMLRIQSPAGSYANLRYTTSSTSSVTHYLPTHSGNIQSCTNLYNNTSGTTGTVTLSESAANFSYIEIFFEIHNGKRKSARVYGANGQTVQLEGCWGTNDGTIQINTKLVTVSGTSITNAHTAPDWYTNLNTGDNAISVGVQSSLKIVRVDGYK